MSTGFDLAQTFYVDADAVQQAERIFITSIDLYIKSKPVQGKAVSGIDSPGMSVSLCSVDETGAPTLQGTHALFSSRVEYANIIESSTGATPTTFTFRHPVPVATNTSKAFLVKFDGNDTGFKLWYNKSGDNVLGETTQTQVTSGKVDGYLFRVTNGKDLTAEKDADLSFKINIAKFSSLSSTFKVKNRPYEIIKMGTQSGTFIGGETVYQQRSTLAGSVALSLDSTQVVGTGTTFNSSFYQNDKVVFTNGTFTDVRSVVSVTNNTVMVLDVAPSQTATCNLYKTVVGTAFFADSLSDYLIIQDSNANSSLYLTTSTTVAGLDSGATANISSIENFAVNGVVTNYAVATPPGTAASATVNFVNTSNTISSAAAALAPLGQRLLINGYGGKIASRTNEVTAATPFESFNSNLTLTTNNPYTSPYVRENDLDVFIEKFDINNSITNEESGRGQSLARSISKTVVLAADQKAEDLKVYVRAFRPSGTDVVAYAKFNNQEDPETIDTKDWTKLTLNSANVSYSNPANISDMVGLEFSAPLYGTGTTATGQFATTSACNVITGTSGTVNTSIAVGSLVRVYSPIIPTTYFLDTVTASNTTTFTVASAVSNASLVATGLEVDVITNPKAAFLDNQNKNILTYFNNSYAKFQTYDSFAVKLVFTSTDAVVVPFVDDVRAIAVSA